jgi:predicted RNase H-like HicB family nuclease
VVIAHNAPRAEALRYPDGLMTRPRYDAVCTRAGDWWAVDVPSVPGLHTQARRPEEVEAIVRDALALLLEVPSDSFDVWVTVVGPSLP